MLQRKQCNGCLASRGLRLRLATMTPVPTPLSHSDYSFRKNLTSALVATAFVLCVRSITSAERQEISSGAIALHANLVARAKPGVRDWVGQEAQKLRRELKIEEAVVRNDIKTRFAGQSLASMDIEALAMMVMMQCARDADEDLRTLLAEIKTANEAKQKLREQSAVAKDAKTKTETQTRAEVKTAAGTGAQATKPPAVVRTAGANDLTATKDRLDSLNGMSETQSLRLQAAMERQSKLLETLSNILKKNSTIQDALVQNLK